MALDSLMVFTITSCIASPLDDGHRTLYIISSDLALFSPGYCDQVLKDVQAQLDIAPDDIWWTATHTHSAPEVGPPGVPVIFMPERYKQAGTGDSNPEYTQLVEAKLIEGLRLVRESLRPARLGIGTGFPSPTSTGGPRTKTAR